MQTPNIAHPTIFEIDGYKFQVVAYTTLTDEQARHAALYFYRTHKFKKKDRGTLYTVISIIDRDTAGLFGR